MLAPSPTPQPVQISERYWKSLSLVRKFMIMGGLVVIAGALVIGSWVARQIEEGVTRNAAITSALYVDSFISPLTVELQEKDTLSVGPIRALDEVFNNGPVGSRMVSVKIWRPDGTIVYTNDYDQIGKKFDVTDNLRVASQGEVVASFGDVSHLEEQLQGLADKPLLEIYSPIRAPWSGEVMAVAEFYEDGTDLRETIASAKRQSWMLVGAVMTTMAGLLMTIVFQGSRTIDRQKIVLGDQLRAMTIASEQNRKLRKRVQNASERVTELNEQFLRKTSAELHDGPAQLLGFAALRIGEVRKIRNVSQRDDELKLIGKTLDKAMREIRNLSKGLSLPQIDLLSVQEIISKAVRDHTDRTKSEVSTRIDDGQLEVSKPVKICIYRFVQEALNNSWKHAPGSVSVIHCTHDKETGELLVEAIDTGSGFDSTAMDSNSTGLGLQGLRERVRSIGGELQVITSPGSGTTLAMRVSLKEQTEIMDKKA